MFAASSAFESCEQELLRTTQGHIQRVRRELGSVIKDLSLMGDSVIMECLNNGAILSERAVEGCYDLHLRQFQLDKQDALDKVDRLMTVLEHYNSTYFNVVESTRSLCGNSLNRTELAADAVLFQLDRCPYKAWISDEAIVTTEYQPTYDDNTECYYERPHRIHEDVPRTYPSTESYETTPGYTTTPPPLRTTRKYIAPE